MKPKLVKGNHLATITNVLFALGHDDNDITNSASLRDDLGVDSLDQVELTMNLEELYGIEISYEEADEWLTVGDVIATLEKATKPKTETARAGTS